MKYSFRDCRILQYNGQVASMTIADINMIQRQTIYQGDAIKSVEGILSPGYQLKQ